MFRHAFVILSLIALTHLAACSSDDAGTPDLGTVDAGTDATVADASNADAMVDAGEYVPDFSCVGSVTWPAATTETVSLTGQILDAVTDLPLAGVAATICPDRADTECAAGTAAGPSGADGTITASIPTGMASGGNGYFGYFRLAKDGYMDVFAFTYRPLAVELPAPPTERLFSPAAITAASAMLGITQSESRGVLIVRVRDCAGQYAAGAEVAIQGDTDGATAFYANGNALEVATSASRTDASGVAGWVNLPAGPVTITASVGGVGPIGRVTAFSASNTMSHMYLGPTPLSE